MTQDEAIAVVASLLAFQQLRPESLFALSQAAVAAEQDGVGGTLIVKIPRKTSAPVDVHFSTGPAEIRLDL